MAHLQYMPGDPRLVDQLVYELKSKGIFDQFRKECIADVDTRPAYQNLRQRVENSVTTFLSRQCWKQDLNKNQLREKLRKHILDGNYLEQGVERIVDQVVNPKIASVFIPQVEDLVYNYLGITRKKSTTAPSETSVEKPTADLLPTDLEAVSPGSVKSNDGKIDDVEMETKQESMDVDQDILETKIEENFSSSESEKEKEKSLVHDFVTSGACELTRDSDISIDKSSIPLPDEMKPENIPPPDNSPPKLDLNKIELPKTPEEYAHLPQNPTEIPLPTDRPIENELCFKPINPNSDNDDSSSDSSLRRNMSPLTPVRNFNTENSCDAQQAFDNNADTKIDDKIEPSSFRFAIEAKATELDSVDSNKKNKDLEHVSLAYQFNNQVNINALDNTPFYEDSSTSNNLQIDYESDANSKTNVENKIQETDNSEDAKKERKSDERRSSHKSSHRSRDSHRHSSSKDKKSNSKQSSSRDSSRHDKKPKDDHNKSKSSYKEGDRSRDKSEKKESRDSSKHRSSHRGSSSQKDSKSNRSSSSSQRSSKQSDDKKSSSGHRDKSEKSSDKSKDKKVSKHGSQDSKSSSHRSEKDKKSGSKSKLDDKDKKRDKKDTDDHYSLSGRGNSNRRSTDRDSNDGSSSSKGSNNPTSSKTSESKKENKGSSSKSDNTSSSDSTSPSDKEHKVTNTENYTKNVPIIKPIVRVDTQLEVPIASPPRLPFVPDVTLKKPKFAANLEEAKKMMKMRKFLDEEQKRMNQEAALLLEFQANVRPSLSQAYSSISGPELEFACVTNLAQTVIENQIRYEVVQVSNPEDQNYEFQDHTPDMIIEKDPSEAGNASNINDQIEGACLNNENIDSRFVKSDTDERIIESEIANETHDNFVKENSDISGTEVDNQQGSEKKNETYEENKPFSQLVDEITEYSKASERMKLTEKPNADVNDTTDRSGLFEVTIITEEISENEEVEDTNIKTQINKEVSKECPDEEFLHYFAEHEKYDAELKKHVYSSFIKKIEETLTIRRNMYLVNCDTYEENIFREVCKNFGQYEIINYFKNGHLKLPTAKNVKNFDLEAEIALPVDKDYQAPISRPIVFSPVKSECSFDLSNDYVAKLEEMVNKTSKQEVLEIILGSVIDDSSNCMPTIDYCKESNIISDISLKRKANDMEIPLNNNRHILTSNKIRKLSGSDQISSTTEESEESSNNNKIHINTRSKYLGRAKRVGLSRPRKPNHPNSPSSDKSVENYEQISIPQTPNGKLKTPQRTKIQRYDTSDLYKPKLHYLSRRNNIS